MTTSTPTTATIQVSVNTIEDFLIFEVPADADAADIAEAIEAKSNEIDGSNADNLLRYENDISVFRNGVEIPELGIDDNYRRLNA